MPQLSFHTPLGDLTLSEDNGYIVSLDEGWSRDQTETPLLTSVRDLIQDYFDGQNVNFNTVPLLLYGTPYQKRVWQEVRRIPHGKTCFYGDIAQRVGGSPRSVGNAVGANPIILIIPCHRVVSTRGIGHYSGFNGHDDKVRLLDLERGF